MSEVPLLSAREVIVALRRLGFIKSRQKGSHIRLVHLDGRRVTVPNHPLIGRGLLRKILRDAWLTTEEFMKEL